MNSLGNPEGEEGGVMKTMHCNFAAPLFSSYPSIFAKIHFRLVFGTESHLSCKVAKKEKSEIGVKGLNSFYGVRKKKKTAPFLTGLGS